MIGSPVMTHHARERQAQRNLNDDEINFVLDYGRHVHSGGALHVFLGRRDLPADADTARRYEHLEGTVLVLGGTRERQIVITVYRNRHALKDIRSKTKYYYRSQER